MQPGVYRDLPNKAYHSEPGVSSSHLKDILVSPAYYKHRREEGFDDDSQPLRFGGALHALIGGTFDSEFTVIDGSATSNEFKDRVQQARDDGRSYVSAADMATLTTMQTKLHEHPTVSAVLRMAERELSVFWTEPSGLLCKCRPDLWIRGRGILFDLKTTKDATPSGAAKAIANYRYHVQAAWYLRGCKARTFVFIFIEKAPPFHIGCYAADAAMIERGLVEAEHSLELLTTCNTTGNYPGLDAGITSISLPRWY